VSEKPKDLHELTRMVMRGEGEFAPTAADGSRSAREAVRAAALVVMAPPENLDESTDVFDKPLGAIVGTAGLRAQANHSRDAVEQKAARHELGERRAKARAASPRPGQRRPTVAEWTERWRTHLSRLTEQQRDEVIFTDVYNALSDRAREVVDGLLIELDQEAEAQERTVEYARGGLLGETEARQGLDAQLDFGYDDEEDLDLEAEAAMFEYDADIEAGMDVAS
jgi:hypothetical protein